MSLSHRLLTLLLLLLSIGLFEPPARAQSMSEYCYFPPSIGSSLPPNVMIVLDNSGSMFNFAYDYNGSDRSTGFDPSTDYFGYFKSDRFYTYSSSRFEESRTKAGNTIQSDEWDGNFLNWLTMRRVDIVRKVLTGGDFNASSDVLVAEAPDAQIRGYLKGVADASSYSPFSDGQFEVFVSGSTAQITHEATGNPFKIQLRSDTAPSGLLDTVWDKVRFGLSFYDEESGGHVVRHTDATTLSNFRNEVNEFEPHTWTPLAETLWTMAGYFAQAEDSTEMPGISGGPSPDYGENRYSTGVLGKDSFYFADEGAYAPCVQSFILFITDGEPAHDTELPGDADGLGDFDRDGRDPGSFPDSGSDYFDDVALYARTTDLRTDLEGDQNLFLYPVFAFGQGSRLLKQAAMNGGFEDIDGDGLPYTGSDCVLGQDNSDGDPAAECDEWDQDRDGVPDTYFEAQRAGGLESALRQALTAILERISSGSTVANISTQTRSGGALLQAYYLPKQTRSGPAGTVELTWKGFLRGLWSDPRGNLRDDQPITQDLELEEDRILQFQFDPAEQQVKARLFPDDGQIDGSTAGDNVPDTCDPNSGAVVERSSIDVASLWEVGDRLATREPGTTNSDANAPNPRILWFNPGDNNLTAFEATDAAAADLAPYWDSTEAEAEAIIKYLRGYDNPNGKTAGFRLRQAQGSDSDRWEGTWKLGPIVTSTPQILRQSGVSRYTDATGAYTAFQRSGAVTGRPSMAFAGANDGMLHAFYPGNIVANETDPGVSAELQSPSAGEAGDEAWAFIPENALPYLRWYGEMDTSCFIPTVDYRVQLIDAAIGTPSAGDVSGQPQEAADWRTLLIGSMGFGGKAIACDKDGDGSSETLSSSIFVLDVTDPENPTLLWERNFSDHTLALTVPAVARRVSASANGSNGAWYLVAASGPTGPEGSGFVSSPSLKVFTLKGGALVRKFSVPEATGVAVGEPVPLDPDRDDITDSVIFGTYGGAGAQEGQLYRLQFGNSSVDPADWTITVAAKIGATTGRPFFAAPGAALDAQDDLWLYGATGRFLGDADKTTTATQYMFGYVESAWGDGFNDNAYEATPTPVSVTGDLVRTDNIEVTAHPSARQCRCGSTFLGTPSCPTGSEVVVTEVEAVSYSGGSCGGGADCTSRRTLRKSIKTEGGWYRALPSGERVFSQPFVAAGLVNVLGFTPVAGLCSFGGETIFHTLDFRTGTAPSRPSFLNAAGFDIAEGEDRGEIASSIELGSGVPPLGKGFTAVSGSRLEEITQLTQTSSGLLTQTQQQSNQPKGLLFQREP